MWYSKKLNFQKHGTYHVTGDHSIWLRKVGRWRHLPYSHSASPWVRFSARADCLLPGALCGRRTTSSPSDQSAESPSGSTTN